MSTRIFWRHIDRHHDYYSVVNILGFFLCQRYGSISSIIKFESEKDAIDTGWFTVEEIKND